MGLKILLVEDNIDICEITSLILTKFGYTVVRAANGREGLEQFRKGDFDLVITDIGMPFMDGNELIARLAEFNKVPPIIALSYNTFDIQPHSAITMVATKPMSSDRLKQLVVQALTFKDNYLHLEEGNYRVS